MKLNQLLYLLNLMHQKVVMTVHAQEVSGATLWQWQMICMSNRSGRRALPLNSASQPREVKKQLWLANLGNINGKQ